MTLFQGRPADLKCVVVGDDSVGKTSMLMGYATNRYPTRHVPSVFDNYAGSLKVAGRWVHMQMIDTLDADESAKHRQSLYLGADVFVVCFSVICRESLRHVEEVWLPEIREQAPETPFILVGAQADLRTHSGIVSMLLTSGQCPVSSLEGRDVARRVGAACYLETSPQVERDVKRLINGAIASVLRTTGSRGVHTSCTVL